MSKELISPCGSTWSVTKTTTPTSSLVFSNFFMGTGILQIKDHLPISVIVYLSLLKLGPVYLDGVFIVGGDFNQVLVVSVWCIPLIG